LASSTSFFLFNRLASSTPIETFHQKNKNYEIQVSTNSMEDSVNIQFVIDNDFMKKMLTRHESYQ